MIFLTAAHPIDLNLRGCIAEGSKKYSVNCEDFWVSVSQESINRCFSTRVWVQKKMAEVRYEGSAAPLQITVRTFQGFKTG